MLFLSTSDLVLRTLPDLCGSGKNSNNLYNCNAENYSKIFQIIEYVSVGWFTFEIILQFLANRKIKNFFASKMIYLDIFTILPFFIWMLLKDIEGNYLKKINLGRIINSCSFSFNFYQVYI